VTWFENPDRDSIPRGSAEYTASILAGQGEEPEVSHVEPIVPADCGDSSGSSEIAQMVSPVMK
jgi:hypothetical protein